MISPLQGIPSSCLKSREHTKSDIHLIFFFHFTCLFSLGQVSCLFTHLVLILAPLVNTFYYHLWIVVFILFNCLCALFVFPWLYVYVLAKMMAACLRYFPGIETHYVGFATCKSSTFLKWWSSEEVVIACRYYTCFGCCPLDWWETVTDSTCSVGCSSTQIVLLVFELLTSSGGLFLLILCLLIFHVLFIVLLVCLPGVTYILPNL